MAWRKQRRDYSTPPNSTMELSPATGNIVVVALRLGLRFAMSFHSNKPSLVLHRPALSAFCFRISFHTGTLSCAHSTSRSLSHTHNPATKTNKASCSKTHPLIHSSTLPQQQQVSLHRELAEMASSFLAENATQSGKALGSATWTVNMPFVPLPGQELCIQRSVFTFSVRLFVFSICCSLFLSESASSTRSHIVALLCPLLYA